MHVSENLESIREIIKKETKQRFTFKIHFDFPLFDTFIVCDHLKFKSLEWEKFSNGLISKI